MTRSELINGYVYVAYSREETGFITITDVTTNQTITFHETVIPLIQKTIEKNKRNPSPFWPKKR